MARDRLPPIEFETVDDDPDSSSSAPEPGGEHATQPRRLRRWVVAGAVVVLGLVAAITMLRLSDERDQAKAEEAQTRKALNTFKQAYDATFDNACRAAGKAGPPPGSLLGYLGAMFPLPSSPSLVDGTIGILVTDTDQVPIVSVMVDGRGAVPGDEYVLEGGVCDGARAVRSQGFASSGSLAAAVSTADGDLRLVGGADGPDGGAWVSLDVDDPLWARLRHNGEDLGGLRGPLAHPTALPPGANPCDLSSSAVPPSAVVPLSAGDEPPSVQSAAGTGGGCAGKAYVVNRDDGLLVVIDTATGKVSATIPVGSSPGGVAITPDGTHAYVTDLGTSGFHGTVWVIDTAAGAVSAAVDVGTGASDVAISPDGAHAYVTHGGGGTVSVIDTATGVVSASIDAGLATWGVAITPDGKYAYVANADGVDGTVSVIDTATGKVSAAITVGGMPGRVAITPDGTHAYVTEWSGGVSVIDTATGKVSAPIDLGEVSYRVAITPDGTHAFVTGADGGHGAVFVIDTATGKVSATITVGGLPDGLAITPDGTHAYVASSSPVGPEPPIHGTVSVIDAGTGTVSTVIDVGSPAGAVAICPS